MLRAVGVACFKTLLQNEFTIILIIGSREQYISNGYVLIVYQRKHHFLVDLTFWVNLFLLGITPYQRYHRCQERKRLRDYSCTVTAIDTQKSSEI